MAIPERIIEAEIATLESYKHKMAFGLDASALMEITKGEVLSFECGLDAVGDPILVQIFSPWAIEKKKLQDEKVISDTPPTISERKLKAVNIKRARQGDHELTLDEANEMLKKEWEQNRKEKNLPTEPEIEIEGANKGVSPKLFGNLDQVIEKAEKKLEEKAIDKAVDILPKLPDFNKKRGIIARIICKWLGID